MKYKYKIAKWQYPADVKFTAPQVILHGSEQYTYCSRYVEAQLRQIALSAWSGALAQEDMSRPFAHHVVRAFIA
jgi:hypothetical protein